MKSTVGGGHRGVGGTEGCLAMLRGAGQAGWGIRMGHSGSAAPHRAGMDPQALLGSVNTSHAQTCHLLSRNNVLLLLLSGTVGD